MVVFSDTKTDFIFLVLSYDVHVFLGSFEAAFRAEFETGFVPCLWLNCGLIWGGFVA